MPGTPHPSLTRAGPGCRSAGAIASWAFSRDMFITSNSVCPKQSQTLPLLTPAPRRPPEPEARERPPKPPPAPRRSGHEAHPLLPLPRGATGTVPTTVPASLRLTPSESGEDPGRGTQTPSPRAQGRKAACPLTLRRGARETRQRTGHRGPRGCRANRGHAGEGVARPTKTSVKMPRLEASATWTGDGHRPA